MSPKLVLHRYFIAANRMRHHFDTTSGSTFIESSDLTPLNMNPHQIEVFLYMSYWYGGLYVVIEGWQSLKLDDAKIDALLQSTNVTLLREFRNGVFHFQKKYFDRRFMDFVSKPQTAVWVRELNEEFGRYFLDLDLTTLSPPKLPAEVPDKRT